MREFNEMLKQNRLPDSQDILPDGVITLRIGMPPPNYPEKIKFLTNNQGGFVNRGKRKNKKKKL